MKTISKSSVTLFIFAELAVAGFAQPILTSQPQSVTNFVGSTATFTVIAKGDATVAYQWFFNSSIPLASATNADLTLTNVQSSNAGGYSVIVTNVEGAVTSVVATLTVLTPPRIYKQPANQTASLFADATFRVSAAGDAPLSYQWRFNDADLLAETNTTLTITNVQRADAGDYNVVVTNLSGSVTSQVATLTITPFNSIYEFGFSWTDTGNCSWPPVQYWHNHACNGPMWPEFLSTNLGLAYVQANNSAHCGATPEDILNQIINYPVPQKPQLSLYCLWRGKPDVTLSTATNQAALDRLLQASILINSNSVDRLYTKGAKVILFQHGIGDIYDFSGLTTNPVLNNVLLANASDYSARFKVQFSNAMAAYTEARPDLRLLFFDGASKFNEILNDPIRFGFTNTTIDALSDTNLVDKSFTGPGADYLNWDPAHGTSKLNRLMASWNLEILTNSILEKLDVTIARSMLTVQMNHLEVGRDYTLQQSSDLKIWTDVQTFTASAGTNPWSGPMGNSSAAYFRLNWQR